MTFVSYAQNFEDVLLWRALGHVHSGFYIDVGAAHPDTDSVTRAFYDRGWSGINIEPTAEYGLRLAAARPRDINVQRVMGAEAGQATFYVVNGTGLSTLEATSVSALIDAGMEVSPRQVEVQTLVALCEAHAPLDIHFLKIDVEGAERDVLSGADFGRFRPWIVVVEATAPMSTLERHEQWEGFLLDNDYRFVWFDGLNRFYVAGEQFDALAGAFKAPPNVFDNFVRAADSEWARRIAEAETRVKDLLERAIMAETRSGSDALTAGQARSQLAYWTQEVLQLRERVVSENHYRLAAEAQAREASEQARLAEARAREASAWAASADLHARNTQALREDAERKLQIATQRAAASEAQSQHSLAVYEAIVSSRSWRITAPLRRLRSSKEAVAPEAEPIKINAEPSTPIQPEPQPNSDAPSSLGEADLEWPVEALVEPGRVLSVQIPLVLPPPAPRPTPLAQGQNRRVVYQFHSGTAVGDAITNAMILLRARLRSLGYTSDIFVEHCDPLLSHEFRSLNELPAHDRYVLIVHHSMGYDAFQRVASLTAPKLLIYHNITPPEFLADNPVMQQYAILGRAQLAQLRDRVVASLADSEYNAIELRNLGFDPVQTFSFLLDLNKLLARAATTPRPTEKPEFTILFVGRVTRSKAQLDLIEVFAAFRQRFTRPSRLMIVGRHGGSEDGYLEELQGAIHLHGLEQTVTITGLVSDKALHEHYGAADVYLSLSRHEGFAVPMMEAMAYGLPILARPAGAIPYTLFGTGAVLEDGTAETAVSRLLALAEDGALQEAARKRQHTALQRLSFEQQKPMLVQALAAAGAAIPGSAYARSVLENNMHFAVTGHINGSYSLAAANRAVALAIDSVKPGRVRLVPANAEPVDTLDAVPQADRAAMFRILRQAKSESGPLVVISQNYPVHVPTEAGDLALAYVFWEESVIPRETIAVLNANFRGVLAPTRFVAKVLVDCGITIPVRLVQFAPQLESFRKLSVDRPKVRGPVFNFLHVSSCFPRKGVDVLLAAYCRAFRAEDPVRLLIKGFPNPHNDVADQIASRRALDPGMPRIELIDADLTEGDLLALYREADAAVLPARGEGFNIPAAEALAAGIPVIVTGAGGQIDFCDGGAARLIKYSFARSKTHLAQANSVWFEPDVEDLASALTEATRGCLPRADGSRIADSDAFVGNLIRAATDILLAPPATSLRIGWISSWEVRCGVAEYSKHLVDNLPRTADTDAITVFPDLRTPANLHGDGRVKIMPCWVLGMPNGMTALIEAISIEDPQVLVIQHQPGLFEWRELATLLATHSLKARIVVVVLHTTLRLLDISEGERQRVVKALSHTARVLVHTIDDLNRLKDLGLVENVTLLPHGAGAPAESAIEPRRLTRSSFPIIGCYGFFFVDKNIPRLISAIALLRETYPSVKLRLVNADYGTPESRDEIEACRKLADAAGVSEALEWHTDFLSHEGSIGLLRECDVIALPYRASKEASSAALRTALTAGPPVAVTPLALFEEAEQAVFRFEGTSVEDITRGLLRLLDDHEERAQLQQRAGEWLERRQWSMVSPLLHDMLLSLHVQASV
jgi:FkbM family methyltransferase